MNPTFQLLFYLILFTIICVTLFLTLNDENKDANLKKVENEIKANSKKIKEEIKAWEAKQALRKLKRLPESAVFINTKTTGLNDGYEIIEIAIANMQGEVLYETKVKPTIPIEVNATNVHGLSNVDIEDAPSFADISEEVFSYISVKRIAGFNIEYDIKALKNSAAANNVEINFNYYTFCVMKYANEILSHVGNAKLTKLCKLFDIKHEGAHSASVDVQLAFQVFKKINQIERKNLTINDENKNTHSKKIENEIKANLKKIKEEIKAKEAKQALRKLKRLPESAVFIDTETTGLNDGYEIIEIAIANMQGEVLYETKVKPTIPIEVNATNVHGLSNVDIEDAPSFADISEEVFSYISGKRIAGFNIEYDIKALKNSAAANNIEITFNYYTFCVMKYANEILSLGRNAKLTKLSKLLGVKHEGAHSASVDVQLAFQVFKKINQIERKNLTNNLTQWSGFINLELDNLADVPDGEVLVLWESSDERLMLFSRDSLMGSGKIAELDSNLTLDVNAVFEKGGDVQFIARPLALPPEIEIKKFSKKEVDAEVQEALNNYKHKLKSELQQAKLPRNNKLRGIIKNDRRDLPSWVNFSEVGDLFIENKSLEEFLAGEMYVQLTTSSGDIIFKQHLNKFWNRIMGVITKGYKAKVVFIEYGKSNDVKVDVLFEQIS